MPGPDRDAARRTQVIDKLKERFFPAIPNRLPKANEENQERDRLSRSLAAFVIQKLVICSTNDAAAAVVDCDKDNGIDAIYYDRGHNILYLVQSKYGNAPDRADTLKFCQGIRDLLAGDFEKFHQNGHNSEFDRLQPEADEALSNAHTQVMVIVTYLAGRLESHATSDLNSLMREQNVAKNWCGWKDIGLSTLFGWLTSEHQRELITVQLNLFNWKFTEIPRRAFYGLVRTVDINSLYQVHGYQLFQKNIRHFLGRHAVNEGIIKTIKENPEELLFLNNGLTAVCDSVTYAGSANTQQSTFTFEGFSIVNGAQTVGAIGLASTEIEINATSQILITILEVGTGEAAELLSNKITQTRNTQNAVDILDFAALDPNQERMRQELAISGVTYYYRPTHQTLDATTFNIAEAILALACMSGDTRHVTRAKANLNELYDRNGDIYRNLVNDNLSGLQLFRQVQINRYATVLFDNGAKGEVGRRKAFFKHGRQFVLHLWSRTRRDIIEKSELYLSEADQLDMSATLLEMAENVYSVAEPMFATSNKGYLSIFRNLTDSVPLAQAVMERFPPRRRANE